MLETESITTLAARIARGEVRAEDACAEAFARIRRSDGDLGAFLALTEEGALTAARDVDRARDEGRPLGALAGVPIALKDSLCTRGVPTTCGSRILEGWTPPYDATVVERLREAGAILVGKTNMDEFGMGSSTEHSAFRVSRNPWDRGRTPGGSSGGSAVAVATRMALGALGSDTGGSVRQPAAFTGTVGLKPTYGRVSRYGLVAFASSLDQVGTLATDVRGAGALLTAIAGADARDSTASARGVPRFEDACGRDVRGLRVGVLDEAQHAGLDPRAAEAFDRAVGELGRLGCEIVRTSAPSLAHAVATYYVLATAEASSNLARFDGVRFGLREREGVRHLHELIGKSRDHGFGAEVKRRILLGTFVLSADAFDSHYRKAQKVRRLLRDELTRELGRVDALLSPTAPGPAPALGDHADDPLAVYLSDLLTLPASLAGLPALSVPCGATPEGLPLGLQIMTRAFDEETALALGHAYERVAPLPGALPPAAGAL